MGTTTRSSTGNQVLAERVAQMQGVEPLAENLLLGPFEAVALKDGSRAVLLAGAADHEGVA